MSRFELKGEFIPLDALLKTMGVTSSGGAAKLMIAAGRVLVDGVVETRKRCKIRPGQSVRVEGKEIEVVSAPTG